MSSGAVSKLSIHSSKTSVKGNSTHFTHKGQLMRSASQPVKTVA